MIQSIAMIRFCFSPHLYRARNLVERFFNKIKHCRRVATRYDKLAANYRAFEQLASSGCGCALMSPRPGDRRVSLLPSGMIQARDVRTHATAVKLARFSGICRARALLYDRPGGTG
jgi:hypothetical protein